MGSVATRPGAWLPLVMSAAGLALILAHVAVAGPGPEPDEGTAARIWWLLMGAQLPLVALFAATWIPRAPRPAQVVLALQAVAIALNLAAVRYFNL